MMGSIKKWVARHRKLYRFILTLLILTTILFGLRVYTWGNLHIDEDLLRRIDAINLRDNLNKLVDYGYWQDYNFDQTLVYRRATENDKPNSTSAKMNVAIMAIDESEPYTLAAQYHREKYYGYGGRIICSTFLKYKNNGIYIFVKDWDSDGTPKTIEAELQRIIDVFAMIDSDSN